MPDDNPYTPPRSVMEPNHHAPPLDAGPVPPEPRIRPLAILVGLLVTIVSQIGLGIALALVLLVMGISLPRLETAFLENTWLLFVSTLLGAVCTVMGAYVAAWMGKYWPLRHAFVMGMIALVLMVLSHVFIDDSQPLWIKVLDVLLVLPSALLGGYLWSLRSGRNMSEN